MNATRLLLALPAAGLLLPPAAAGAGEAPAAAASLDEIVVVANRIPVAARRVGASVSVLTEDELAARGGLVLSDALRGLPGVSTVRNGGMGASTSLRIRGEDGFRTLVLYDGMKLSDPGGPQVMPHVHHLLSAGVGRVEVLRGPHGFLHGADAGGVVSIASPLPERGLEGGLDVQAGRFGARQTSVRLGGAGGPARFFLSGARADTDGFNARDSDAALMDEDGYENASAHAYAELAAGDGITLRLAHRRTDGETEYDGCFDAGAGTVHECLERYELRAGRFSAEYSAGGMRHALAYSETITDRDYLARGVSGFAAVGELKRWEYLGAFHELPGFDLVLGADREEESGADSARDNAGRHIELISDFSDALFLSVGARRDDSDAFGRRASYRLSAAWLADAGAAGTVRLKASLGTGFRAPSPYESAYNRGPFAYPPAAGTELKEESSAGRQLGVEYYPNPSLRLEAVYFDQETTDAIRFDLAGFSGYLQDEGVSESSGWELSGEYAVSDNLRLSGNITLNDAFLPDGRRRPLRPERLFNAGLGWTSGDGRLGIDAFYRFSAGAVEDAGGATAPREDFGVLDAGFRYRASERVELRGRIENALDEDYQEISGYNTPGRAAYVGVRLGF